MESDSSVDSKSPTAGHNPGSRHARRRRYHQRIYFGLLIFVVIAGAPMVGVSSLRVRLRTRVQMLRAAVAKEPLIPAPAIARVGENHEPFPQEYEHAQVRPYLPKIEAPARSPIRIVIGGNVTTPPAPTGKAGSKPDSAPTATSAGAGAAPGSPGSDSQYQKGKSQQEAYDILVNSNQVLAGMIKGSDPSLKFQDWAASNMGQDSFNVMVTFIQTSDNVARKYIWNVKVPTKEVVPLSAYAREISK